MRQIINPHSHSSDSLDGAASVQQIIQRNLDLGAPYVALTEHGNMASAMELYTLSKKMGAKPILGIEAYLEHPFPDYLREVYKKTIPVEGKKSQAERIENKVKSQYTHLTIHFKDEWAYEYFCRLTPKMEERAIVKYGERKPVLTLDELAGASGHITIGSGCLISAVNKFLIPDRDTKEIKKNLAKQMFEKLLDIAGKDNFFVEIFPHKADQDWVKPVYDKETNKKDVDGYFKKHECSDWNPDGDLQKTCNICMMRLAKIYGVKPIISLDSHFATPDQYAVQNARLGNGKDNWRFHTVYDIQPTAQYSDFLQESLNVDKKTIEEWVDNSYLWASNFDNFKIKTNKDRWAIEGAPENWLIQVKRKIDRHGRMNWADPEMNARLKKEIDVLAKNKKMNLMNYLFTVEDIANFCKENDILINVRGSAGGSFLLYLLGVSAVNPLKYNLSFERFLTLGRIDSGSLPDADIDVSAVEREKVFEYLEGKYGDKFARIKIDTTLKLKSSIKDSERQLKGEVSPATEKLCASLPNEVQGMSSYNLTFGYTDEDGNTHAGLIETNESLKQYAENNPKIWSTVKAMLGCKRQASVHPCYVGETLIYTIEGDRTLPVRLDQCDKKTILTGQGNQARAHLLVRGKKQVMEFTLENGTKLKATPDHPMLTENGWVPIIEVFQKGLSLVCPLPIANQTPLNGAENV